MPPRPTRTGEGINVGALSVNARRKSQHLPRHTPSAWWWAAILGVLAASSAAQQPGPRYGHELVYDESSERVLLFGGFHDDGEPLGDTWVWDGEDWQLASQEGPQARKWPASAHDSRRKQTILFGGRAGIGQTGDSLSDTWAWEKNRWRRLDVDAPPARDHHRMVYDRKRERIVLFGGWNGEALLADTWEWDGTRWERVADSGPPGRAPFGLAYDERSERVILFGGKTLDTFFADTWAWDGTRWDRLDVTAPSPRAFHAMTYDSVAGHILLFSGRRDETMLADTWAWDGSSWIRLARDGPRRRGVYAMVFDRARRQTMFYGSGIREADRWILRAETWLWRGQHWRKAP